MDTQHSHKSQNYNKLCLKDFDVSSDYGFLLPDALTTLPDYFSAWNDIAHSLPELILMKKLRQVVDLLAVLDHNQLNGEKEYRCAQLLLCVISQVYVWLEGDNGVTKVLPKQLAIPFCGVSDYLGIPPVLTHASFILANWRLKDHNGPFEYSNLSAIIKVPPVDACSGFILTTAMVEKRFAPALKTMLSAFDAVLNDDTETVKASLTSVINVTRSMHEALSKMHENLAAPTFYHAIRPYLAGWGDAGSPLPEGLIYEGVSSEPHKIRGGNGAQSCILQCLDAFLRVQHPPEKQAFLNKMRTYMLPKHAAFIEALWQGPSVKQYVINSNGTDLKKTYHKAIQALEDFRSYHIQIVTKYVVIQTNSGKFKGNESIAEKGTGGTASFMAFLKSLRDSTREHKLNDIKT